MDFDEPPAVEQVHQEAAGQRAFTREDGTLVIDILVREPCGGSTEGEIVVCAPDPREHRLDTREPIAEQGFKPELQIAPNVKAGLRTETEAASGAVRALIDFQIKF